MKNFIIVILVISLFSCEKELIGQETGQNTPVDNFELLWEDFSEYYGEFNVKNIDWDSLYVIYRPQISDEMTEESFYQVITGMLSTLYDPHVTLYPTTPGLPRWSVDLVDGMKSIEDFDMDLILEKYIIKMIFDDGPVQYGLLADHIGYVHIDQFEMGMKFIKKVMPQMILDLNGTTGLIIDIRDTPGGRDPEAQLIAGYFVNEKKLYMTSRKKNGPGRNDFADPVDWFVEPQESTYTQPIILLSTSYTMSGAETFTWALRRMEQVTHVGDTTGGAFSDMIMREMYNGWLYSISVGDYRDSEGNSYEGMGIPPDIYIQNTPEDIERDTDIVLESAINLLN